MSQTLASAMHTRADEDPESAAPPPDLATLVRTSLSASTPRAALLALVYWWSARLHGASVTAGLCTSPLDSSGADAVTLTPPGPPGSVSLPDGRDLATRLADIHPQPCFNLICQVTTDAGESPQQGDHQVQALLVYSGGNGTPDPEATAITSTLLTDLVRREERLLSRKLEALAEFAAGAGHEINNPLGTILGRVQLLARNEHDPERRRLLATIGGQALRVRDMIGDIMLFARPPAPQPEPLSPADIIPGCIARAKQILQFNGDIHSNTPRDLSLFGDPVQFPLVIDELLRNAIQATLALDSPTPPALVLSASRDQLDGDPAVRIEIVDQGIGLTEQDREHLFDPFYSGRQAGRGLGFGLSKCWRIVNAHGGYLTIESTPGQTVATVLWPQSQST